MTKLRKSISPVIRFLRQRRPVFRWKGVDDPRSRQGRRYALPAILNSVVLAMMCGAESIRLAVGKVARFDSLAHSFAAVCSCRRTAIGNLLPRLDPAQLRDMLHRQIRGEWRRKALQPDRLPLGLAAVDGKALWSDREQFHPESQDQSGEASDRQWRGHRSWVLRATRAALVSCSSCPVIDQQIIPAATNEVGFFATFFRGLMAVYGRLGMIQAISADAGLVSRANAALVREAGVHYIFRLKSPQRELWREANRVLLPLAERTAPEAETEWESDTRGRLKRQLWRTADMAGWNDWDHLCQVWLVRTLLEHHDGTTEAIEDRFYLSSLGWHRLDGRQILDAVRFHWGVENDAHGTADVFFDEDHSPCSKTGEGIVCASLLRLVAMNLCQLYRHRRRSKAQRKEAWQLVFDDFLFPLRLPAAVLTNGAAPPT